MQPNVPSNQDVANKLAALKSQRSFGLSDAFMHYACLRLKFRTGTLLDDATLAQPCPPKKVSGGH